MLQLILKDFRAYWLYQLLSLFLIFFMSLVTIVSMLADGGYIYIDVYIIGVILACSFFSGLFMMMDESFGANAIYASLPVSRMQIVAARYATSFFQIILVFLVCTLSVRPGAFLQEALDDPALPIIYHPATWVVLLSIAFGINCFTYPFIFKFGLGRGAIISGISQIILLGIGWLLFYFSLGDNILLALQSTLQWISSQSEAVIILILGIFYSIIVGASILLSGKFYKNKDI